MEEPTAVQATLPAPPPAPAPAPAPSVAKASPVGKRLSEETPMMPSPKKRSVGEEKPQSSALVTLPSISATLSLTARKEVENHASSSVSVEDHLFLS